MSAPAPPVPGPIVACTICRDVRTFNLLVRDMEAALGERWGDLGLAEALAFLTQDEASGLQFVALALGPEDEGDLDHVRAVIAAAKARGIKVILIAGDVSPTSLHALLREGGDEFIPYPLPEGELARAIARVGEEAPALDEAAPRPRAAPRAAGDRSGVVIPVYAMAGGAGATTLAVNLAWELATIVKGDAAPRVCLIDLGLQWGSVATSLDLTRHEAVLELLSDVGAMDGEAFVQALQTYNGRLQVLTAPADLVPLDLVSPGDVESLIEAARVNFDYVVVDMPLAVAHWGEAVLNAAHVGFALLGLDMRSAQNTLRLKRALSAEGLPFEKLRFVLNRAPGAMDFGGKGRVKRMADSLGIGVEVLLPDGGRSVAEAADQGVPLALAASRNPLRRAIARLARSVHEVNVAEGAREGARASGTAQMGAHVTIRGAA